MGWKAGLQKQALFLDQKALIFMVKLSALRELAAASWGQHNLSSISFILETAWFITSEESVSERDPVVTVSP